MHNTVEKELPVAFEEKYLELLRLSMYLHAGHHCSSDSPTEIGKPSFEMKPYARRVTATRRIYVKNDRVFKFER